MRLDQMHALFARLRAALTEGEYHVVGQVPAEADLVGRVTCWLSDVADAGIAQIARVS